MPFFATLRNDIARLLRTGIDDREWLNYYDLGGHFTLQDTLLPTLHTQPDS